MAEAAPALPEQPGSTPPVRTHARARPRPRSMSDWIQLVAATNAVVLVLNLLTGVVSARVMGPAGKGVFNAINVWTGVFTALAGMGLPSAFISAYSKAPEEEHPGLARAAFSLSCFWGLLGTVAVYMLEPALIGHMDPRAAAWARLSSPLVAVFVITGMGGAMISVQKRFGALNWVTFARTVLYAACVGGLALWGVLNPYSQLSVSWLLLVASSAMVVWVGVVGLPLRLGAIRWQALMDLSGLGLRYYSLGLLGMFNSQLDQMIASAWLSARDMGLYAVAISSLSVVGVLQGAVSTVMFPMIAGDSREAVIERTSRMVRRLMPLFVVLMVLVCASAWPVLLVLYGRVYLPAVSVVLLIAPTAALVSAIMIFYQAFYALRWFAGPTLGEGMGAASGAILLWVLIPRWGLQGAAVAATASYALDLAVVVIYWCRASGMGIADLLTTREDLRYLARELRTRLVLSRLLKGVSG